MFVEGILLLAGLIVIWFTGSAPLPLLIVLGLIIVICVPTLPLVMQKAPPFIPTPKAIVDDMIALAVIKKGDRVYDLGCGDGRLLLAAAKQGAIATGYELSIPALLIAKWRTRKYPQIDVRYGDFWKREYSDADVIFCYLLKEKMKMFEETIWLQMKPGTRVVSHAFKMPTVAVTAKRGGAVMYTKPR